MMMRKITFVLLVLLMGVAATQGRAEEVPQLPFASDIRSDIVNYNRAMPRLATSGAPSKGAYKELSQKGVRIFIDLRNQENVVEKARAEAKAVGAQYYNIPVYGHEGISKEQVEQFAQIFEGSKDPVLLHCGSGNRVGALWTAYQLSKNIPATQAIAEGKTAGLRAALLEDVKRKFCKSC